MTDLRKDARGRGCLIRIPGHWCADPTRVVLCHIRMIGLSGTGLKAPDLLAAFGCDVCHKIVDGQVKSEFTYDQRRLLLLEGVMRTQAQWIERGIVTW